MASLLPEMTDLEHLTHLPRPAYRSMLASSYDRRSTAPGDPDKWFANHDYNQFVRDEPHGGRIEHVMMDATGPGAVVRLWAASPAGTLRIYVDGSPDPVVAAPMADLLGGKIEPFYAPLSHITARGANLYFPIPFREHCTITTDAAISEQAKLYYQVDYRSYAPGTAVEPFTLARAVQQRACVDAVARELAEGPAATPAGARTLELHLAPGAPFVLDQPGGGAIARLVLHPSARDDASLRDTVLAIAFDGRETVRVPLGDFFASGPGYQPFHSLPFSVDADGALVCRFPMPFRHAVRIALEGKLTATGSLAIEPYAFGDDSLYFHAAWHAPDTIADGTRIDWPLAAIDGAGVFAGVALEVNDPGEGWWGEGDEKIYVDGEAFPSHFGTGTEDYFGYAWSTSERFDHAYHNTTRADSADGKGRTAVDRFHVLDPIPFTSHLRFDLEVLDWSGHPFEFGAVRAANRVHLHAPTSYPSYRAFLLQRAK